MQRWNIWASNRLRAPTEPNIDDEEQERWLYKVKQHGYVHHLKFAPERIRGNKHVMLSAICRNSAAFNFVTPELKENKEFIIAAVHQDGMLLEDVSPMLQNDREVVITAVRQNGLAIGYASPALWTDKLECKTVLLHSS